MKLTYFVVSFIAFLIAIAVVLGGAYLSLLGFFTGNIEAGFIMLPLFLVIAGFYIFAWNRDIKPCIMPDEMKAKAVSKSKVKMSPIKKAHSHLKSL